MTPRIVVYAVIVVTVGAVAWIATGPQLDAQPSESDTTAAPASTLAADTTALETTTTGGANTSSPVSVSPATDASPTTTTTVADGTASTAIQHGDEGSYDGTEPESVAVDFVVGVFADCWSCDAQARQEHLTEIADPQVVAQWPPMGIDERSVFTVRTVTVDDVVTREADTIVVTASVTTDTDIDPSETESVTVEVRVVDGIIQEAIMTGGDAAETTGA